MGNYSINKINKEKGEITGQINMEVRVFPIAEPKGNTRAYASVTIEEMFGIHGISLIEGKNGMFVAMPQTKDSKNEYRDIAHPITSEGRKELNEAVLAEYAVALGELEIKQESTLAKIKEAKQAAAERSAPDKAQEKNAAKGVKNKNNKDEL